MQDRAFSFILVVVLGCIAYSDATTTFASTVSLGTSSNTVGQAMAVAPNGQTVFALANIENNAPPDRGVLYMFNVDATTQGLTLHSYYDLSGDAVQNGIVATNNAVYVMQSNNVLVTFNMDPVGGLVLRQNITSGDMGSATVTATSGFSPNREYAPLAYMTDGKDTPTKEQILVGMSQGLLIFDRNAATGELTYVSTNAPGSNTPTACNIIAYPSDMKAVYCYSSVSPVFGNIHKWQRNPDTGALSDQVSLTSTASDTTLGIFGLNGAMTITQDGFLFLQVHGGSGKLWRWYIRSSDYDLVDKTELNSTNFYGGAITSSPDGTTFYADFSSDPAAATPNDGAYYAMPLSNGTISWSTTPLANSGYTGAANGRQVLLPPSGRGIFVCLKRTKDTGGDGLTIHSYKRDVVTDAANITSPAASGFVAGAFTLTYGLPETALGGSLRVIFSSHNPQQTVEYTLSGTTALNAGTHSFSFNPSGLQNTADIIFSPTTGIVDGIWNITVSYQDTLGNPGASTTVSYITVDTVTERPSMSAPTTNLRTKNPVAVSYTLPETPAANSVELVFSGTVDYIMRMASPSGFLCCGNGPVSFNLNPHNPSAATQVDAVTAPGESSTIPDGTYSVYVRYQNNPGGSAVAPQNSSIPVTGVVIDTVTNQPSLTNPSSATTVSNSLSVVYVLTEDMQSVTLKFAGSSNFDIVMQGAALTTGTKTFSLDLNTPTSTSGSIVSSGSTVTDGTYTLSVQAVDSLGNAANSSAGVGVTVDRVTTAPVVSKPVSGSNFTSVDSNLDVDVTFPDPPLQSSVVIKLVGQLDPISGGTATDRDLTILSSSVGASSGLQMFTLNINSIDTTPVNTVTPAVSKLPDGLYSLTVSYQDSLGNPAATSSPAVLFRVDTSTAPPILTQPETLQFYTNPIPIQYSLPEPARSVSITFQRHAGAAVTTELTLTMTTARSVSLEMNPKAISNADPNIQTASAASIPDGNYSVTLTYQDAYSSANPPASDVHFSITVDTQSNAPSLHKPLTFNQGDSNTFISTQQISGNIPVEYTFSEQAGSGALIFRSAATGDLVLNLTGAALNQGLTSFNIVPTNPSSAAQISVGPAIPDGTYDVILLFSDRLNNSFSQATSSGVLIDHVSTAPILAFPTSSLTTRQNIQFNYTLLGSLPASIVRLSFQPSSGNPTIVTFKTADAATKTLGVPVLVTLDTRNVRSNSAVDTVKNNGADVTDIPDGTYTITLQTKDFFGNPDASSNEFASASVSNVVIDSETQAGTITEPTSGLGLPGDGGRNTLTVQYTLPETPLPGSVQLRLTHSGGTINVAMNDSTAVLFTWPVNPVPGSLPFVTGTIPTLTSGTVYAFSVLYQDAAGNTAKASNIIQNVKVDFETLQPTLSTPETLRSYKVIPVSYSIPELALTNSITLTLASASYTQILTLNYSASVVSFNWDPLVDPLTYPAVIARSNPTVPMTEGTYTATLSYQDYVPNSPNSVVVSNVEVDFNTIPPVLYGPTAGTYTTPVPMLFELKEPPSVGSLQLLFLLNGASSPTSVVFGACCGLTFPAATSSYPLNFSFNLPTSPPPATIPDGTYTVSVQYQDAPQNAAQVSNTISGIVIDTVTLAPTLTLPAADTAYTSPVPVSYSIPETATAGSVKLYFIPAVGDTVILTMASSASGSVSFTWPLGTDPSTLSEVASVFPASTTTLQETNFTVVLNYTDTLGNPMTGTSSQFSHQQVSIDLTTATPTLSKPTAGGRFVNIPIEYTLPEAPKDGTVQLIFAGSFSRTVVLTDLRSASFSLNTIANLSIPTFNIASGPADGIPEGLYSITLSYQDKLGNTAATAVVNAITVDKQTQPPVLTSPADSSVFLSAVNITYSLPEQPAAGSVSLLFNTGDFAITLNMDTLQYRSFLWAPSVNTSALPGVISSQPAAARLADGTYTVTLSYRDVYGNAANFDSNQQIVLDTQTQAATLSAPPDKSTYDKLVLVSYIIPEEPTAGSVKLTFTNQDATATQIVLVLSDRFGAGAVSFSFDPSVNVADGTNIMSVGPSDPGTIPSGRYSVVLSYQDVHGNPLFSTSGADVFVDYEDAAALRVSMTVADITGFSTSSRSSAIRLASLLPSHRSAPTVSALPNFNDPSSTTAFGNALIGQLVIAQSPLSVTADRYRLVSVTANTDAPPKALVTFDILPATSTSQTSNTELLADLQSQYADASSRLRTQTSVVVDTTTTLSSVSICVNEVQVVVACAPDEESTSDRDIRVVLLVAAGILLLVAGVAACIVHRTTDRKKKKAEQLELNQHVANSVFQDIDTNDDGVITRHEFEKFVEQRVQASLQNPRASDPNLNHLLNVVANTSSQAKLPPGANDDAAPDETYEIPGHEQAEPSDGSADAADVRPQV